MHSELCGPGQQSGCLFFFYLKLFWTSSAHLNKSEGNGFYTYTCYDLTIQHIQQFICWRREGIAVLFSFLRVTSFFFSNLFTKKKGIAWASAFSSRPSHNWLNSTDHIAADKSNSPLFVSKKKKGKTSYHIAPTCEREKIERICYNDTRTREGHTKELHGIWWLLVFQLYSFFDSNNTI